MRCRPEQLRDPSTNKRFVRESTRRRHKVWIGFQACLGRKSVAKGNRGSRKFGAFRSLVRFVTVSGKGIGFEGQELSCGLSSIRQ